MYENNLQLNISGKAEITYIRPAVPTSFNGNSSTFVSGYCETYSMKQGQKAYRVNINFTADGPVADHITELGLKVGDTVKISGRLSNKKETRYKDNNGKDVYFPAIRLETIELVFDTTESFVPKQDRPLPQKKQPTQTAAQKQDEIDAVMDDLPF